MKPTACSTWASRRSSTGSSPTIPQYRQTLLFSATMPPEVEALARKYLRKPIVVQVGRATQAASTVTHAVYPVPRDRKSALLVELLKKTEMDSVLVFTRTKHGADKVVRNLEREGIAALAMHADKSQGAAHPGAGAVQERGRSACSSPPTSRSAGSTLPGSRT